MFSFFLLAFSDLFLSCSCVYGYRRQIINDIYRTLYSKDFNIYDILYTIQHDILILVNHHCQCVRLCSQGITHPEGGNRGQRHSTFRWHRLPRVHIYTRKLSIFRVFKPISMYTYIGVLLYIYIGDKTNI